MLVKINSYSKKVVNVTQLDIDEYGSVIPIIDLNLKLEDDPILYDLISKSIYAALFLKKDLISEESCDNSFEKQSDNIIISVIPMTLEDLNDEKKNVINFVDRTKSIK